MRDMFDLSVVGPAAADGARAILVCGLRKIGPISACFYSVETEIVTSSAKASALWSIAKNCFFPIVKS